MTAIIHTLRRQTGIAFRLLTASVCLGILFLCSGCSQEQAGKVSRDVYIYVFSRDYDANVNQEWLATQEDGPETLVARGFEKGTWISLNQQPDGDIVTVTLQGEKFDVDTSVLTLLTPEQYRASLEPDTDSPDYLRNLDEFLKSHNVIMLSDGTAPAQTAQSADTDFLYICIPALLLLIIGYICSRMEEGSLILPAIGILLMISQIVIFIMIVGSTGVNIRAAEIFILAALLPAIIVMSANIYAGTEMSDAILRHYGIDFSLKSILICLAVGIAACAGSIYVVKSVTTENTSVQYALSILTCYGIGILAGSLCFCIMLYRKNPASCKAAPMIILIFLLTALFGAILLLIYFVIWLCKILYRGHLEPGGNLLGSSQPRHCCANCQLYNSAIHQCAKTFTRIDDPNTERDCCQL